MTDAPKNRRTKRLLFIEERSKASMVSGRLRPAHREQEWHKIPPSLPPMESCTIGMVVTCKGRLAHLRQTLPQLLNQQCSCKLQVLAVDYDDPDGSFDYCMNLAHPRLSAIRVLDNAGLFNLSRARNCGANALPTDILCFVDADSLVHPDFVELATEPIRAGRAALTKRDFRDKYYTTFGLCCVRTQTYHDVRGYDEAFEGWGPEDMDFYYRIGRISPVMHFQPWLYPETLSHSDMERTRFHKTKDRVASSFEIAKQVACRDRTINPDGYGRARVQAYVPDITHGIETWEISESRAALSITPSRA
jgi:glycosyltransferase involved in cell wall biosynthesis